MLNVAIIMGRLTRDPELRRTNSGKTVAVDRDYAPDGQEKETDFIDCVAWNGTAEFVQKYFNKGSMIVVKGRLQLRNWTDKEGNKRRTAEIMASNVYFGESKKSSDGNNSTYNQNGYQGGNSYAPQGNQPPQNYGGYQPQVPQQGYNPNSYKRQVNAPQFNQQGFGGYQQGGYPAQNYQPPHPQQGSFATIDGDDAQLPF